MMRVGPSTKYSLLDSLDPLGVVLQGATKHWNPVLNCCGRHKLEATVEASKLEHDHPLTTQLPIS